MPLNNRLVDQPFDVWEGSGARWITKRELAMTTERKNKYVYLHVIQGDYGQGWEDETAEESYKEARERLKEYRENMPEYPHRMIQRREPNIWES